MVAESSHEMRVADTDPGRSPGLSARRSGDPRPGNLPASVNSFLGREPSLRELTELLDRARLVTLTGPPGIGKSRLGVELAHRVAGDHPDGAWIVELAPVAEAELVPAALASTLSLAEEAGRSLTDTILARLRGRRMLLVLDNCEHLVGACALLADTLLRGCAELRIVATSRESLSVTGEQVWPVAALALPPPDCERPESLYGYESVGLFVERARAAAPDFELTPGCAAAVGEICRRLDGIPLAIELAAARVPMLTCQEIAERLDDRFELLVGGSRSDLPRHQTLQAAVDWSYDLLDDEERALLARLSAFAGRFTLGGAEAVCSGEGVTAGEVLSILGRLVAKSLVVANTSNSHGRYRMLETVRAYAADRLAEHSDARAYGLAHARFYLELAERAEPEFHGAAQDSWFEHLESERENLRAAMRWSIAHGKPEWALRLGGALVLFWRVRCHFSEGRRLLEAALDAGPHASPAITAKARWGASFLALMSGDRSAALALAQESLASFRELGDGGGCGRSLLVVGDAKLKLGEPDWRPPLSESAALARRAGDAWCQTLAVFTEGFALAVLGDLSGARPLLEECLAVARQAGERYLLNYALIGLGMVSLRQGDYAVAQALLSEAADGASALSDDYTHATALEYLGELALRRGELAEAQALLDDALAGLPDGAPPWATLGPLTLLGLVAHAEGDRTLARALFREASSSADGTVGSWRARQGLAALALEEGDAESARRLFEDSLEWARAGSQDDVAAASALHGLGEVARAASDVKRASMLHNEALALRRKAGDAPGTVASIEALGSLALVAGDEDRSARLLGAVQGLRGSRCYARSQREAEGYEADLARIGASSGHENALAARAEGARLSLPDAASLASRGRGRRGRPPSGWSSLTDREQQIAMLVTEGLTNPEIAERLLLSSATVKSHVSRVFPKLGVGSRRELAREVLRRQEAVD